MSEKIVVEATSDKFKNKYNNGSVLAGGKWMQVDKNVPLSAFRKDSEVTVELKTNDKGYTSIVGLVSGEAAVAAVETAISDARKGKRAPKAEAEAAPRSNYEENKNRRILVQGIVQASVQSPALMSLDIKNPQDIADAAKVIALDLIAFVDEEAK